MICYEDDQIKKQCIYCYSAGPTEPTGPSSENRLRGLQLQLNTEDYIVLETNQAYIFNEIINQSSPDITYDNTTGQITFMNNATYYVSWCSTVDGTIGTTQI